MVESWTPLYGWEKSHQISSLGAVRSLSRTVFRPNFGTRTVRGKTLKQRPDKDGYMTVCLNYEGKQQTTWVHIAVAESFVCPRPVSSERIEVRHLNGQRTDNRAANLSWGTSKQNSADMVAHGTRFQGESHPRARLKEDQVRTIRASSETNSVLAKRYGVGRGTIDSIKRRRNWKWIND